VVPASDVYALGVLLFRLLTGGSPWQTETVTQLIEAHRHSAPADLPDNPGVPDEVRDLCRRCLAKRPEDRPEAAEVARVLGAVGPADLSLAALSEDLSAELSEEPDPDAETPDSNAETQVVSARAPARRPKAGRRRQLPSRVGAALSLLALVLFTGFCAASGHQGRDGPSAAANPPAPSPAPSSSPDPSDASGTPAATSSGAPGGPAAGGAARQPGAGTGRDGVPAPAPDGGATRGTGAAGGTGGTPGAGGGTSPVAGPVPEPVDRTISTVGGTVLVRCLGDTATLLGVNPAPAFVVAGLDPGPGSTVGVVLRSPLTTVRVGARCRNGEPVPTISTG
jgi:serine/threonine-protein kinase